MKGLERFLGTVETQTHELMETSSGEAKYEHQHKAIVWRVPRLPKLGQGMTFFLHIIIEKVEKSLVFLCTYHCKRLTVYTEIVTQKADLLI